VLKKIKNSQKTLCIVAGGSGGHILPALQLAQQWKIKHPHGKIILCTNNHSLEKNILNDFGISEHVIFLTIKSFSHLGILRYVIQAFQILFSFLLSCFHLVKHQPNKIISTGGIIALPVCMAGKLLGFCIELHELNVVPGKAIKFLHPYAHKIFITFKRTKKYLPHAIFEPYPHRFTQQDKRYHKENIINDINKKLSTKNIPFESHRKTLFLLGGSQGSMVLNTWLKSFVINNKPLKNNIQIIHQTGSKTSFDWNRFYQQNFLPASVFTFQKDLKNLYQLADLVICRAGAGTLFELKFFEKKCIVVPLITSTTNHQVQNAQEMAQMHPELFTIMHSELFKSSSKHNDFVVLEKLHILGKQEMSAQAVEIMTRS